jgi:hypothetical protein
MLAACLNISAGLACSKAIIQHRHPELEGYVFKIEIGELHGYLEAKPRLEKLPYFMDSDTFLVMRPLTPVLVRNSKIFNPVTQTVITTFENLVVPSQRVLCEQCEIENPKVPIRTAWVNT